MHQKRKTKPKNRKQKTRAPNIKQNTLMYSMYYALFCWFVSGGRVPRDNNSDDGYRRRADDRTKRV